MVYESCPEFVIILAVLGGVLIYLVIGALISFITLELAKNKSKEDRDMLVIFSIVFWPLFIVGALIYIVGMWILFPLFGATRDYVDNSESRLNDRIDAQCSTPLEVSDDDLNIFDDDTTKFKVGDIVTGIVPQTDYNGNNISYEHLYKGCKCRVLRIDSNNSMKVILIDHVDKEAHKDYIGKQFTAPARNFTLVKKPTKKRKAAKKKSKR